MMLILLCNLVVLLSCAESELEADIEALLFDAESGEPIYPESTEFPRHVAVVTRLANGTMVRVSLSRLSRHVADTLSQMQSERDPLAPSDYAQAELADDVGRCLYAGHVEGMEHVIVDANLCTKAMEVRHEPDLADDLVTMLQTANWLSPVAPTPQNEDSFPLAKRTASGELVNTYTRYLETFFLINYKGYQHTFRKMTDSRMMERISELLNRANVLFQQVNVALIPVGLYVIKQNSEDPARLNSLGHVDTESSMRRYSEFVRQLRQNKNKIIDTVVVLTDSLETEIQKNVAGRALMGAVCRPSQSVAFVSLASAAKKYSYDSSDFWTALAITLAHEIGHLMDYNHDSRQCDHNIMCAFGSFSSSLSITWSAPSAGMLKAAPYSPVLDLCMMNKPTSWMNELLQPKKCGNGILEDGELCDCGAPTDKNVPNFCGVHAQCMTSTCKLTAYQKSTCLSGPCCEYSFNEQITRNLLASGSPCRNESLAGYFSIDKDCYTTKCNGRSTLCEVNHVANGKSCDDGNGYCYEGHCKSMQFQCELAYSAVPMTSKPGKTTWQIDQLCNRWAPKRAIEMHPEFEEDRLATCVQANCVEYANYVTTTDEDELANLRCKTLMCMNDKMVYNMNTSYSYFSYLRQPDITNTLCVHYNNSITLPAGGVLKNFKVEDGTKCAEGKVCKAGLCQPISRLYPNAAAAAKSSSRNQASARRRT